MQEQDLEYQKRVLLEDLAEPSEKTFDDTLWDNRDRGEPSFKSFEEIAKEHEALIGEIFGERIPLEKLLYRVEGYVLGDAPEPSNNEEALRFLKILRLYRLLDIIRTRQEIATTKDAIDPTVSHRLGSFRADLRSIEHDIQVFDQRKEWLHRIKAREYVGPRHEPQRALYDTALAEADRLWAEGSQFLRHEMAEHLHEKYPSLSFDTLQKKLSPLAERHGKLWDAKAPRGQRNADRRTQTPTHRAVREFSIDAKCFVCGQVETVCSSSGQKVTAVPRGECSTCRGTRVFTTYWPDGEIDRDEPLEDALASIDEFNHRYSL